jgi:lysyl-tRNA synthetase class 1
VEKAAALQARAAERDETSESERAADLLALRGNPSWFIQAGHIPEHAGSPLSFGMLLNLASVANAETPDVMWGFIRRYDPTVSPQTHPMLATLVERAIVFYADFVRPAKSYRLPSGLEQKALVDLAESLKNCEGEEVSAEMLQNLVFEIGKRHGFEPLRDWFTCLYEVLLGQSEGPRFGGFIALYGVRSTIALIEAALVRSAEV